MAQEVTWTGTQSPNSTSQGQLSADGTPQTRKKNIYCLDAVIPKCKLGVCKESASSVQTVFTPVGFFLNECIHGDVIECVKGCGFFLWAGGRGVHSWTDYTGAIEEGSWLHYMCASIFLTYPPTQPHQKTHTHTHIHTH